jgi:hypothetical protein
MGQMFKVLAVSEPNLVSLAGFSDEGQDAGQGQGTDTGTKAP